MNLKKTFAASLLFAASIPMAQATTYNITAVFDEPASSNPTTQFDGSFDFDGTSITNLMGTMNQSMHNAAGTEALSLGFMNGVMTTDVGGFLTATVFKVDGSTDVYWGGGYQGGGTGAGAGSYLKYGATGLSADGNTANENAYFTLAIDPMNITGEFTLDSNMDLVNSMEYGDCAPGGLMGPMMTGNACMAGEVTAQSMMAGIPQSFTITEVTTVPVPAAVWLFGSALVGLLGTSRRKLA